MLTSTITATITTTGLSSLLTAPTAEEPINHKVKIFLPCHYDLSQVETCAPFLDRYGGVVFVYDWNVAKDTITDYYRRQYPDGWVKVVPFSLRNILDAIKNLDHRLYRYEDKRQQCNGSMLNDCGQPQQFASTSMTAASPIVPSNGSVNSVSSMGSFSSTSSSNYHIEARQQHQVVFLLTGSMNPDYGVFGLTQKRILDAIQEALPERVRAVNVIGHCMYGCASCSGVDHKVPLYFTRYFNKTLPYTAQDVFSIYTAPKGGLDSHSAHAVLVAPSCGGTSMLAQKPLIQLFHRLEQSGRWRFIWKMHPTSLHFDGYNTEDASGVEQTELENVKFILANFTVTQEEHTCLLPFMEAFDVIITDLHSSVPFIATYFTPKVILSYFNDADYGTPDRHQEFMDQLNTFVEPEELEGLLNNLPTPKGDPSFFHSQYGYVDGKEDLRFGNLAGWPTEQFEPSHPFQYRQSMAQIALEWKKIYRDTTEAYPDDTEGAKNALGFHDKFPLLQDEDEQDIPMTLPRVLPPERRAAGEELRIMSFNIWNGGLSGGQSLEQTAKAILASGADVVGLQECSTVIHANGRRQYMLPELMEHLPGWYYSDQKLRTVSTGPRNPWGIVSKFPIVSTTAHGFGVKIQLNNHCHPEIEPPFHGLAEEEYPPIELFHPSTNGSGRPFIRRPSTNMNTRFMYLFNCHLYYFPYQPFQLLKIPYQDQPFLKTAEEAIQSCIETRSAEMDVILNEIQKVAEQEPDVPIFLTGDFNEPSHLDWTPLAVMAGLQPMTVKWPMTHRAYKAGLVDLWRAYQPHYRRSSGSGAGNNSAPTSPTSPLSGSFQSNHNLSMMKDNVMINEKDRIAAQVIERPGYTWTVLKPELVVEDHYDRIDYIFGLNRESSPIALKEVAIKMGEEFCRSGEKNDKVLKPWPSDHRAVVATVLL
ncbi:MAG: Endonuclease/exonuclease/phosphatase [Benniella sp.]|nr:MAG: Endonuclease/exonuclease/phosphatase [Benniella sp.]